MQDSTEKSARLVALEVLDTFKMASANAAEVLAKHLKQTPHKARATDIVYGVIRNMAAVDMIIEKIADKHPERIAKKLINIIRIGVYELVYSTGTAQYAIVNEAVELANIKTGKKQASFVNAILRNVTRGIVDREAFLIDVDPCLILPNSSETGCSFDKSILPAPDLDAVGFLSGAYSLPEWLVKDWVDEFGFDKAKNICIASNRRPCVYIQPNTLRTTAKELAEAFRAQDVETALVPLSDNDPMIKLLTRFPVTRLYGFDEGLFFIQDFAAASVIKHLSPQPGWVVVDLCAAPGTKSMQIARQMHDEGTIIASDIDDKRLMKVKQNADRLGYKSIQSVSKNKLDKVIASLERIDAVLIDVPCSNTGVLAKRPEVRYRINKRFVNSLVKTQRSLLDYAASIVSQGGTLCYSTCSILRHENEDLISVFCADNPQFKLHSQNIILPEMAQDTSQQHDGSFSAILVL